MAPSWHTAVLVAIQLAVAAVGWSLRRAGVRPGVDGSRVMHVYLPMIAAQWLAVLYVSRVGRARSALRALVGARWFDVRRAAVDVMIAIAAAVAVVGVEIAARHLASDDGLSHPTHLLPRTASEHLAWWIVAASVGFGEEVVFRGYYQTQFRAWTRRPEIAIVMQAVLFGLAHGDRGGMAMACATIDGVLFGVIARWRRSLVPTIVCHVAVDAASAFAGG